MYFLCPLCCLCLYLMFLGMLRSWSFLVMTCLHWFNSCDVHACTFLFVLMLYKKMPKGWIYIQSPSHSCSVESGNVYQHAKEVFTPQIILASCDTSQCHTTSSDTNRINSVCVRRCRTAWKSFVVCRNKP
jgi:hypothetical protein